MYTKIYQITAKYVSGGEVPTFRLLTFTKEQADEKITNQKKITRGWTYSITEKHLSDTECQHPYVYVKRIGDYEECTRCKSILQEG